MQNIKNIFKTTTIISQVGIWPGMPGSVCIDSREVLEGSAFAAIEGTKTDGHLYIQAAIASGARIILCKNLPATCEERVCYLVVNDPAIAAGELAEACLGFPSKAIHLIGVTGTNGKTTISTLLFNLFTALGYPCGLISTIKIRIGERELPATHTTPDTISLHKIIAEMVSSGCAYCFMEVSSHAIAQNRIAGLTWSGGIFTNLTHDHLDYHKTFKAYLGAKKTFFDQLPSTAFALTNKDDKNGAVMVQNTSAQKKTYGLRGMADYKCRVLENHITGLHLSLDGTDFWSHLAGDFNAYNLTAVYGTACELHQQKEEVLVTLSKLETVEGRFELIQGKNNITAIIDYAHTPDALDNILQTIREIRRNNASIITVAGAGGDRDTSKRPEMAQIAAQLSDRVILTSDNPRSEDPEHILDMMEEGLSEKLREKVIRICNRKEAIKTACALAQPGDIILVAGKGHEKYQEIKGVKYPFDDKKLVKSLLTTER